MRPLRALLAACAAAAAFPAATPAAAGRDCEQRPPSADAVARGMALAQRTAEALDASGAAVVVLARAGQDLSAHGLAWSHLGLAYRDAPGRPWRVVHKLNHCGTAVAALHRQGLGEFFLDDPARYEAAYAVLEPALQRSLLAVLPDDGAVQRLHVEPYNMLAHPASARFQQSNQWALETLAAAQGGPAVASRAAAQAWLRDAGYRPTTLKLGTAERLGARLTRANITFDDHPTGERFAGRIDTVTVDSVFAWLVRANLGRAPVAIR
jgi:hypothetical protein